MHLLPLESDVVTRSGQRPRPNTEIAKLSTASAIAIRSLREPYLPRRHAHKSFPAHALQPTVVRPQILYRMSRLCPERARTAPTRCSTLNLAANGSYKAGCRSFVGVLS